MKKITLIFAALLGCFASLSAQTFTESYNSNTGWTHQSVGNPVSIQNGKMNFNQNYCGGIDEYQYKPLGFTLDNSQWTMDFEWTGTSGSNVGVAGLIASLTSQNIDPAYTTPDTSNSVTNNNTISVLYFSCYGCGSSGNGIEIITKRGTSQYVWHNALHIPLPFNQTGYIRLERLSANTGMISVFSDAARTQHLSGSPRCFPINPAITDLQYLQHGTWVPGSSARYTSGNLDNTVIENNVVRTAPTAPITGSPYLCPNRTTQLNAYQASGTGYIWSNGSTASAIMVAQSGTYSVTVTSTGGCIATGQVTVGSGTTPNPFIVGTNIPCGSTTALLTANDLAANPPNTSTFNWSTQSTASAVSVGIGTYTVTVTNISGCTATNSHTVLQSTPPPAPYFSVQGNTVAVANPQVGATYQWYQNNTPIQGATNEAYTINNSGVYSVCVNTGANCQACSSPIQLAYLGTADGHNIALQISPNPTAGQVFLSGLPNTKHQIRLFSSIGQLLFATYNNAPNYALDLSTYPSGVYMLQIENETWKLVKE